MDAVLGLQQGGLYTTYFGLPQLLPPITLERVEYGVLVRDYHYLGGVGTDHGDGWSVRWDGYLDPPYSEKYTFAISAGGYGKLELDGGVRVFVNEELILDTSPNAWLEDSNDAAPTRMGTIMLQAHEFVALRVELTEQVGQVKPLWHFGGEGCPFEIGHLCHRNKSTLRIL